MNQIQIPVAIRRDRARESSPIADAAMTRAVEEVLASTFDPELPGVSLLDLGLYAGSKIFGSHVEVSLRPTFLGCPALDLIAQSVSKGGAAKGLDLVVVWVDDPWSTAMIRPGAFAALVELGIALPSAGDGAPSCPYCNSAELVGLADVSTSRCRRALWCSNCRSAVDVFSGAETIGQC